MIFLIDRRFLDIRITVKGFISNFNGLSTTDGDQYILSADLDQTSYPGGKKDCIAIYQDRWIFVKPNHKTATEVINLSTGEILKYTYHSNYTSYYSWDVIGYVGAYILPYVVDKAVSSHSAVQGRVGLTYIVTGADNHVYKVTGTGANDYSSLSSIDIGQKIGVVEDGRTYTVISNEGTAQFSSDKYEYIAENTLVLSRYTQNLYMSSYSTGEDLVPANQQRNSAGEQTGTLCVEKHVFTAAEIAAQRLTLNNPALENAVDTLMCFFNGNVHMYYENSNDDFYASRDNSTGLISIQWNSESYKWYTSEPRENEVAIFQYYKI